MNGGETYRPPAVGQSSQRSFLCDDGNSGDGAGADGNDNGGNGPHGNGSDGNGSDGDAAKYRSPI